MSIQFNETKHTSFLVDLLYRSRDQTADVYFMYTGPSGDPVRIPAHRNVLAISSTVLNDLFFGPQKVTGDIPTRSNTVSSQTFEAFISLTYGMNLKFSTQKLPQIKRATSKLKIFQMNWFNLWDFTLIFR